MDSIKTHSISTLCKICGALTYAWGNAKILGRYVVQYYRCQKCEFIQTEDPYWLDEAYSSAITKSDIGLVSRNILFSQKTRNIILACFDPKASFLDYGGGNGMFVRLMRDKGFDFYRYDPICENLFAEGFDTHPNNSYSLLTAWEVFEHLADPMAELEKMLSFSRTLLFSTTLLTSPPKPLEEWWYYGLEHGQHIAFYSSKTIDYIARRFNLKVIYSDDQFHLLSDQPLNLFKAQISMKRYGNVFCWLFGKTQPRSLLSKDFYRITGKKLE